MLTPLGWWLVERDRSAPGDGAVTDPVATESTVTEGVMLIRSAACGENTRCGTAFAAEVDGETVLLTNRHVVEDACSTTAEPWSKGGGLPVREVRLATDADVAVLIVDEEGFPTPLPVADTAPVMLGEPIRVVGFPAALPVILDGHVQRMEEERLFHAIDIDQGASGSPVIDAAGAVIGQLCTRARPTSAASPPRSLGHWRRPGRRSRSSSARSGHA